MNETSILNRGLAQAIARQGHGDEMIVCDAGFAIPDGVEVIDLSLSVNRPTSEEVIAEIVKSHSIEGLVVADMTEIHSPSKLAAVRKLLPDNIEVKTISHPKLKKRAGKVKTIVRTGDFTAYANFLLVSGAGERWFSER